MVFNARNNGDLRFHKHPRTGGREMGVKNRLPGEPKKKPRVRKLKPVAVSAPELRARAPGEHPDLLHLRPHECKWPVHSGQARGEHYFCAAPRKGVSPYCEAHDSMAFQSVEARRAAAAAKRAA
jgi:hypothetical protein